MADFSATRTALAAQIAAQTGLRAQAQVKDQISPPVALILPGVPPVVYGATMSGGGETTVTFNMAVHLLLSDAAPTEKVQRALDVYLGIGPGPGTSIAAAIMADMSLGGTVEWCIPVAVTTYGQVDYAAEHYFGARITVQAGAH